MRKRRTNLGYFISEGFHSIFSHGLMSFAAVCMIVACLIIMGSFSLLALNADQVMSQLESENVFYAYIDENYTDEQITELEAKVKQIDNVASVLGRGTQLAGGDSLSPGLWFFHKSICAFRVPLIYRLLSVRSTHWYLFPSSLVFYNYIIIERQSQFVKQFFLLQNQQPHDFFP